jgi:hypothetical protein
MSITFPMKNTGWRGERQEVSEAGRNEHHKND